VGSAHGRLRVLKRQILALPLLAASVAPAVAQSTWNGPDGNYNTNANWTPAIAPVSPGQSAIFSSTGQTLVNVTAAVNPDSWTFNGAAQAYTFLGAAVTFATATGLVNNSGVQQSVFNSLAGIGAVQQSGAGTLILAAANTYTGGTTITAGTLAAAHTNGGNEIDALGSGTVTLDGGTLRNGTGATPDVTNNIVLGTNGGTIHGGDFGWTLNGTLTGTGPLIIESYVVLNGAATHTGSTTINPGATLEVSSPAALAANTSAFRIAAGGALELFHDATIGSLADVTGAGGTVASSNLGTVVLTVGGDNTSTTFSGTITQLSGSLALTKVGTGTLTLAGVNTYSGGTIINGGALQLGDTGIPASMVGAVLNNALFTIRDSSLAGVTTVTNNGNIDFRGTSSAANASFINNAFLDFRNSSTAANATILNNASLEFHGNATAANAVITNNAMLSFVGMSTGGNAQVTNNVGATLDVSGSTGPANDGKLSIGSIAGAGDVYLGGSELTVGGLNLSTTISGVISDCGATGTECIFIGATGGSLVKAGTGTLTLTGNNTYTGGTIVNGGTLQIGDGGATGLIVGNVNVATGATLAFNRSDTVLLDGQITGGGNLVLNGGGILILTGDNTYTGGTTIAAGNQLQIGAGGATGSIVGDIVNNGTLAVARTGTLTLDGVIFGTGNLVKSGTSTLVLNGDNSYSGGTTVSGGTIQLGHNNALGTGTLRVLGSTLMLNDGIAAANNISLQANLDVSVASGTGTLAGVISQFGGTFGLTKTGAGTLILTGTNTYMGGTTISAGTLLVNGSIAPSSDVTVQSGAVLGGTGQLPATTINNGGALSPGNSIGTITVNGNLAFNAGAIYVVEVSPTDADRTVVTGTASLTGAAVLANFAIGSYLAKSYTILTSAGLGGTTFAGLNTLGIPAGFAASLSYTGTDVTLDLIAVLGTSSGGLNGNQQNVATALNNFFNGGGALPPEFLALFGLSGDGLAKALTQLSGENANGLSWSTFQAMAQFLGIALDPFLDSRGEVNGPALAFGPNAAGLPADVATAYAAAMPTKAPPAASFAQRWSLWGSAYGGHNKTSGDVNAGSNDLTARAYGFATGADYRYSPSTILGFAIAGGGTNWSLANSLGGGSTDALHVGVYGSHRFAGSAYFSGAFGYAHHWVKTDRSVTSPVSSQLKADFGADVMGGRLETGYRVAMRTLGLTPYAALQAIRVSAPAYSETATSGSAAAALSYASNSATTTRTELGLWFDSRQFLSGGQTLSLRARAAWAHNWFSDPALAASFQTLPGTSFIVNGAAPAKDAALLSAAAEYRFGRGWSLAGKLDSEFGAGSRTYAGTATLRRSW
jgi:autotransporter-associated beta strand protein